MKHIFLLSLKKLLDCKELAAAMDVKNNPWYIVSVIFICFSVNFHVSIGTETISANQSLSGDRTVVSGGGRFELGFFNPGNSTNFYLGIWYRFSEKTIVWVGNRDKPVSDRFSSELRISNGNLILFNESGIPIWSTNLISTPRSSTEIEAVLLDEGNLVLRGLSTNSSVPLWQSFDNPTDTFLPGMKFGRNKLTKINQVFTSWKNKEDPAPGLFSSQMDPDVRDQYFLRWNSSEHYWYSGIWRGQGFTSIPEMMYLKHSTIFNVTHVSNENESYVIYTVADPMVVQLVLDASGQFLEMYWHEASKAWFQFWSIPRQPCEVYAYCGAFGSCSERSKPFCDCLSGFKPKFEHSWKLLEDFSGGCVRKTPLQCENNSLANGKSVRFSENRNMISPKNPQSVEVNFSQCETICLNKCSCTAFAYENNVCSIWIGDLLNLQQVTHDGTNNGSTIYVKLAASEFSSPRNNRGAVIGGVVGSVAFILLLGIITAVYFKRKKRSIKASNEVKGSLVAFSYKDILHATKNLVVSLGKRKRRITTTDAVEGFLVPFPYKDLQHATKNFSQKLGEGGFGSVFKGVLPNSRVIAVKKLESINQGEKQFRSEITSIGIIQHINLVQLLGFCSEGTRKLLVYDFMTNGSLDFHLFHGKDSKVPDWKTRYKIALGTAKGLAYLHDNCRDCIIHCDIKPENILLDAEFCPKIADFGLAKLFGREFSRALTTMRGTRGYLAPEWISGVAITAKADVYSYGMMLYEIVSGRRNSKEPGDGDMKFYPIWAARLIAEGGDVLSLLDPRLDGTADVEEVSRICKLACWCIQDYETHRPSMGEVVKVLEGVLNVTESPISRCLQACIEDEESTLLT